MDWGAHAVAIQRRHPPADWPAQLAQLPETYRSDADRYLRSIARRMRTIRLARGRR
jgi:hypothetical protein